MTDNHNGTVVSLRPTLEGQEGTNNIKEVLGQLKVYQHILREYGDILTSPEIHILLHIVDHAVGFKKNSVTISYAQIEKGSWIAKGTAKTASAIKQIIRSLKNKGLLETKVTRDGTVFTIPEEVCIVSLNLPKRLRHGEGGKKETGTQAKDCQGPRQNTDTDPGNILPPLITVTNNCSYNDKSNHSDEPSADAASPRVRIRKRVDPRKIQSREETSVGAVEQVVARHQERQSERLEKIKPSRMSADDIFRRWKSSWQEHIPEAGCPNWSVKEKGMAKHLLKAFPDEQRGHFLEFIDYAVCNWLQICSRHFHWMTKPPAPRLPTISFLLSRRAEFMISFLDRHIDQWLNDLPRGEQEEFLRLIRSGKSRDEAQMEIAKRRALAADRKQREKDLKDAAMTMKVAQRMKDEAQQVMATGYKIHEKCKGQNPGINSGPRSPSKTHRYQQPSNKDFSLTGGEIRFTEDDD